MFIDSWQQQSGGQPFAIGDEVEWKVELIDGRERGWPDELLDARVELRRYPELCRWRAQSLCLVACRRGGRALTRRDLCLSFAARCSRITMAVVLSIRADSSGASRSSPSATSPEPTVFSWRHGMAGTPGMWTAGFVRHAASARKLRQRVAFRPPQERRDRAAGRARA